MNRNGMKWNREETILAFDLYCRIPRSKISQKHPEIIDLAELINVKKYQSSIIQNLTYFKIRNPPKFIYLIEINFISEFIRK